jgi:phage-related protein
METLPDICPSYSPTLTPEFAVDTNQFGDGYELRRPAGLNSVTESWQLNWNALSLQEYELLHGFLVARKGVEAFRWQAPWDSVAKAWVCTALTAVRPIGPNLASIQATFKEDHNL